MSEKNRWHSNYNSMENVAVKIRTAYDGSVARAQSLEMKTKDLKKSRDSLNQAYLDVLKKVKIKPKDVEYGVAYTIVKEIVDTVIVRDTIIETKLYAAFDYNTKFVDFSYLRHVDSREAQIKMSYNGYFTITQHDYKPLKPSGKPYRIPRKWFIRKVTGATLTCDDPDMIFKDIRIINKK